MNETERDNRKFIADNNLGRLAKWLRLFGYDTLYYQKLSLFNMSRIARDEERIFLTRSQKNARLKIFGNAVLIRSSDIFEQLKELASELDITPIAPFCRCSLCNQKLNQIEAEKVRNLVPDYVYQTNERFMICRKCGRIYWPGTHNRAIKERFAEIINRDTGR